MLRWYAACGNSAVHHFRCPELVIRRHAIGWRGADGGRRAPTYSGTVTAGRAFFVYTGLRILLLLGVGALLYATGARGFLLVVLAFLVSGALSLVWLDRPRAKMSQGFGNAVSRVNDKIDAAAAAEDEPLDQASDTEASEQEADAETESRQQ